jgi:hypothetical protein
MALILVLCILYPLFYRSSGATLCEPECTCLWTILPVHGMMLRSLQQQLQLYTASSRGQRSMRAAAMVDFSRPHVKGVRLIQPQHQAPACSLLLGQHSVHPVHGAHS